jgi:hypothetical protein
MALLTNAILSLEDVKGFLDIPQGDTDYDGKLESVVNALTTMFAVYTGRDTIMNSAIIEYTEGKGDDTLWLRNTPVVETTSSVIVWIDEDREYGDSTLIARANYVVYLSTGKVVLDDEVFPVTPQSVKASYYGGWVTLPADLRWAALEAAQWMWKRQKDGRVGVTSVSAQAGGSVSYEDGALPKSVTDVLDRYRRWSP